MKKIENIDGYFIDMQGNVYSTKLSVIPRKLKQTTTDRGYKRISLRKPEGGCSIRFVHRLVATAFVGPQPTRSHQVNHIDGNKANNNYTNLEWLLPRDNIAHAMKELGIVYCGEDNGAAKYTEADAYNICHMLSAGYQGKEISKILGVSKNMAYDIKRGRTWKHISSKFTIA